MSDLSSGGDLNPGRERFGLLLRSLRRKCGGVSGHHLESAAYKDLNRSLPLGRLLCILAKYHIFNNVRIYRDRRVWVVQGFPNFTPDAPRPRITTHFILRIVRRSHLPPESYPSFGRLTA